MKDEFDRLCQALRADTLLCPQSIYLALGECHLQVCSNSQELLDRLTAYFKHLVVPATTADMLVTAIECDPIDPQDLGIEFSEWKREPGKTNRKDSIYDLDHARVLRKVRTGMVFIQSETQRIAAGPCLKNDNQVINFINAQYMNWLQQRDWLICHAAGLVHHGQALALAGFSGGGKSTLMLHMLDTPDTQFLSNDRLFIKRGTSGSYAAGIPKLPRINPGTIVHNPRLHDIIPAHRHDEYLAMPKAELWELEEKYDVMIDAAYGPNRICSTEQPLAGFLVLNWQHSSEGALKLQRVDLNERRDLLAAIMKSPGPFYQDKDGAFLAGPRLADEEQYLDVLADTPIYEASGRTDFAAVVARLDELLGV